VQLRVQLMIHNQRGLGTDRCDESVSESIKRDGIMSCCSDNDECAGYCHSKPRTPTMMASSRVSVIVMVILEMASKRIKDALAMVISMNVSLKLKAAINMLNVQILMNPSN